MIIVQDGNVFTMYFNYRFVNENSSIIFWLASDRNSLITEHTTFFSNIEEAPIGGALPVFTGVALNTGDFYIKGVPAEAHCELDSFTVTTVPSAVTSAGRMVLVTDESGGAVPAFSDGVNWRRVTDRNIIS